MPREVLKMTHPAAGTGSTTVEAFHAVHEAKGWTLDTDLDEAVDPPTDPPTTPDAEPSADHSEEE